MKEWGFMFLIFPKVDPGNWIPRSGSGYTNDISSSLHGDQPFLQWELVFI